MSDLISRQAAIDGIADIFEEWKALDIEEVTYALQEVSERLQNLPTAEKRGKWISEIDTGEEMLKCSVCEARVIKAHYEKAVGTEGFKHCPYCGARMEQ